MPKSTPEEVSTHKLNNNRIDFIVEKETKIKNWRSSGQIYQTYSISSPLARLPSSCLSGDIGNFPPHLS